MSNKLELTKSLTSQFTIWTVEDAMQNWWQNPNGGWRLTPVGLDAFMQLELEHWDFETPKLIPTPSLLLALDRHLTSPYYISVGKNPRLCFFNSKEATMYALYQDVKRFVAALQRY